MNLLRTLTLALALLASPAIAAEGPAILIFSHTTGYRHESIPVGIAAIKALAQRLGIAVATSEDPASFDPGRLDRFGAIVLLSSTTDPKQAASEWLTGLRRDTLQKFVRDGRGVVAVHAAADSHYHWPWYGRLIGGRFARHPDGIQRGRVRVTDPTHRSVRGLPGSAERADEWYYFDDFDPTSRLLVTLDPASIGEADVNPNPVSWAREVDGGRVFYTAMGHTSESYSDPFLLGHLGKAIEWALFGDPIPPQPANPQ